MGRNEPPSPKLVQSIPFLHTHQRSLLLPNPLGSIYHLDLSWLAFMAGFFPNVNFPSLLSDKVFGSFFWIHRISSSSFWGRLSIQKPRPLQNGEFRGLERVSYYLFIYESTEVIRITMKEIQPNFLISFFRMPIYANPFGSSIRALLAKRLSSITDLSIVNFSNPKIHKAAPGVFSIENVFYTEFHFSLTPSAINQRDYRSTRFKSG